ncbi:MAG: hypothetical protein IJS89_04070 [Bacteroidaceae bacterium]|nr:hypothetical protein [Bacteroidaceae bacterium]
MYNNKRNLGGRSLLMALLMLLACAPKAVWGQQSLPYAYNFYSLDIEGQGWTKVDCTGKFTRTTDSEIYHYAEGESWDHYAFQFYSDDVRAPQYIISPEFETPEGSELEISFWYASYYGSYTESFKVGYSTTDNAISSFTWKDEVFTSSRTMTEYRTVCPEGTKYICIQCTSVMKLLLIIDDFHAESIMPLYTPTDFKWQGYTATTATFSWQKGKNETAWQIAYAQAPGFNPDTATKVDLTTTTSATLTGLTTDQVYFARIRANYGNNNYSDWTNEVFFKPTNSHNITVNNGDERNTCVPIWTSQLYDLPLFSKFIIPQSTLLHIAEGRIEGLAFHNYSQSVDFGEATFKVYMNEIEATNYDALSNDDIFDFDNMQEVYSGPLTVENYEMALTLDTPYDYQGGNLQIAIALTNTGSTTNATEWRGIQTNEKTSLRQYRQYNTPYYIEKYNFLPETTFTMESLQIVKKPRNLQATTDSIQTATLQWTDYADSITDWQIAYATGPNFNPDTEGTKVTVTSNPFTLADIPSSPTGQTYYVYLRTRHADTYSRWSNLATFTLLPNVPILTCSATAYDFGTLTEATPALPPSTTFTLTNSAGADLTQLSITSNNPNILITDADGNTLPDTLKAQSSLVVRATASTYGLLSATLTISGTGISSQAINLTGCWQDNTKILETFHAQPPHWKATGGWTFDTTNGAQASATPCTLTTPKISVGTGEALVLSAILTDSTGTIIIEGTTDGGTTWTAFTPQTWSNNNGALNTSDYTFIALTNIPAGIYNLRITAQQATLGYWNGFTYLPDPVLAIYSDAACTNVIAADVARNFGFVTKTQTQRYYLQNAGTGQLDLAITTSTPAAAVDSSFIIDVTSHTLAENEVSTLTLTMPATLGLHEMEILVTATNHDTDQQLGTFTISANGAVAGNKYEANFAKLSELPAGWTTTGWEIVPTAGYVQNASATPAHLTTITLVVNQGETMLVEAQGTTAERTPTLSYSYKPAGADWQAMTSIGTITYDNWKVYAISDIPAGEVKIRFTGTDIRISHVYGFEAKLEPVLISTAAQLAALAQAVNQGSDYSGSIVRLMADIDLSDYAPWTPIGTAAHPFSTTFDGQGYTITNLQAQVSTETEGYRSGLFGYIGSKGTVQDLTVSGTEVRIDKPDYDLTTCEVGAIAGRNEGTIVGCANRGVRVYGNVDYADVGGIVGHNAGTITNCYNLGRIYTGSRYENNNLGGIAGLNAGSAQINNCFVRAEVVQNVSGSSQSHPICADNLGSIAGCFYLDATDADADLVIAGYDDNDATLIAAAGTLNQNVLLDSRTLFTDESWNTLCLPFNLPHTAAGRSPIAGATVRELDLTTSGFNTATRTLTLNFIDVTDIVAGRPYIVKWDQAISDDLTNPLFVGATIANPSETEGTVTTTDGNVAFIGLLSPLDIVKEDKSLLYFGADNLLYYPNAPMQIGACRAYFRLSGLSHGVEEVRQLVLNLGDTSLTTHIQAPTPAASPAHTPTFYTLDGRRLSARPTSRGIYIQNGQKVFVK